MSDQQLNMNECRTLTEIWEEETNNEPAASQWLAEVWTPSSPLDPSLWCDPNAQQTMNPLSADSENLIQNLDNPVHVPMSKEEEKVLRELEASISHASVVQPFSDFASHTIFAPNQAYQSIDVRPSMAWSGRSALDPVDLGALTNMATPPPSPNQVPEDSSQSVQTAAQPCQWIPRPAAEYNALMSGLTDGPQAYQTEQHQWNEPSFIPSESHTALELAVQSAHGVSFTQRVQTPENKRKRSDSCDVPAAPSKKQLLVDSNNEEDDGLSFIEYQGGDVDISAASNNEVAVFASPAARLIGTCRNHRKLVHARPWGLQRMLTQRFVEQKAAPLGIPVPPITDDDIHMFCYSPLSPYSTVHSTITPECVDLRLLRDIEISAEELLTFFPHHLKWHDMIFRLAQNGWSPQDMAAYINFVRGFVKPQNKRGNTVLKWLQAASDTIVGLKKGGFRDRKPWKTTCFTAKQWVPHDHRTMHGLIDYFLVDLSDGVVNMPQGDGARLLTRAIRLALTRKDYHVRLSQVHQYIRENLLIFPPLRSMVDQMLAGRHPDVVAVNRAKLMLQELKDQQRREKKN
ncbi:hypothetical protein CC86DRAFT_413469 [Ophiobolus disseminans]|uniref:Uncharacterized protein n=1 Tax=Ophiobolus disseminans TaxID=1469910 RepID=A0A6A6ZEW1_9PLEO|nr:hypothetical protein CC86DRAFT_413469 [Ophiobolus disseminans]